MKDAVVKIIFATICLSIIACSKDGDHMPLDSQSPATQKNEPRQSVEQPTGQSSQEIEEVSGPTFNEDIQPIFSKYCSACHKTGSGLPNWVNYTEAFAKKDRIMDRDVITRTMPPAGSPQLQESEIHKIKEWIEHGAPESKTPAIASTTTIQRVPTTAAIPTSVQPQPTATPSPVETAPRIYCQQSTYYDSSKSIRTNNMLSATVLENVIIGINSTNLSFDTLQRLTAAESIAFLRPNLGNPQSFEVCGVVINDKTNCEITNTLSNQMNSKLSIICAGDTPVSLNFVLKGIEATISCKTPSVQMSGNYTRCGFLRK